MMLGSTRSTRILLIEDVQETRDAIEGLLRRDGYNVDQSRDEEDAVGRARANHPDLILVSLGGSPEYVLGCARRVRQKAGLADRTPIVVFSIETTAAGAEEELFGNVFVTVPDSFNQLRALIKRVIRGSFRTH
jgi:DNA-binding response OmpR family regulator